MKKTTLKHPNNLTKRLAQYGALTAAIAGVADANGQIIYTDITPDEGGAGVIYSLDMDNDGNTDFVIRHFNAASYGALAAGPYPGNGILGSAGSYDYPFALSNGNPISSGQTTWISNSAFQTLSFNSCAYPGSNWCGQTDKYLGLRFQISGATHYGWARLDVGNTSGNWLIKDYAYNSVAGEPINAGQTTLSIDEFGDATTYKVSCNNSFISIYNINSEVNYKVISITGQTILEGKTATETHTIDASRLASGVYVIEISNPVTNSVFRKKIAF